MATTPDSSETEMANLDDSTHEIAAFAALVRRSSSSGVDDDDDNASLVSLPESEERLGLIDDNDEECFDIVEEGCDRSLSLTSTSASLCESPSVGDEAGDCADERKVPSVSVRIRVSPHDDYDDEVSAQLDQGPCQILLSKVKANPALSVATTFMGVLTAMIWTNERFRFILHSNLPNRSNANGDVTPFAHGTYGNKQHATAPKSYPVFPAKTLLGISVPKTPSSLSSVEVDGASQNSVIVDSPYDPTTDFQYEKFGRKRTLLYWEEVVEAIEQSGYVQEDVSEDHSTLPSNGSMVEVWTNISAWGPCYPRALPEDRGHHRALRAHKEARPATHNWTKIVQRNSDRITDDKSIVYPTYKKTYHSSNNHLSSLAESLGGFCRPGFLIIGQGKCGTSSLYHYLTGHPRILPAKEKQIHYFRYHRSKPLMWYYSHFPTIESFLGRGALMTGEASPGYMPYPDVVESVVKRLSPNWKPSSFDDGNGVKAWKEHVRRVPKIIAIVRDPISRAISSYKYNYIEPAMKRLRSGKGIAADGRPIPAQKSDKYYQHHHLFSFEELAFAELTMLKECLKAGGRGESWSSNTFGKQPDMFFYESIQRRNNGKNATVPALDSSPLIHLDDACYTATKSKAVPRAQWIELAKEHPNKILQLPNLQLTQSLIGRGVYALPLGWWYEVFSNGAANKEQHIHVVCTEDMADATESVMEGVTKFLGLPEFDFSNVTSVGRYNVGGHRGYDKVTKAHDDSKKGAEGASKEEGDLPREGSFPTAKNDVDLLAISDALMNELIHFYHPFNERLFQLIGKRCPWK